MRIDHDHWLVRVRRRVSPNSEPRAAGERPELVVVHCISLPPGRFGTGLVEALFLDRLETRSDAALADLEGIRVSAHVLIDRRGRITQFVPFDRVAWHAGASAWRGRPRCNRYSIGIELEGTDTGHYTERQYRQLLRVLRALLGRYPGLAADAIVGHQEIAPERKRDPGPRFDWPRVLLGLAAR